MIRYRVRGDDRPIPTPDRPEALAPFEATGADEIIELHMAHGAALLDRAGDLIMTGIAASGSDRGLADNFEGVYTSVHGIHLKVTRRLETLGHLRGSTRLPPPTCFSLWATRPSSRRCAASADGARPATGGG